ncbi:copper resistance CopC family protein [Georgenia subflava]|uniref:Copper resistance protein CopC n=1 Tax=Georgenia subflava TaxID=1622177 RepID=A0A6N7EIP1_9MICO|nr:copper resistance CopC family protein [Georgenia subflava]MPV36597.1 copper resistance protein CopC [Georgenia subflava]
MTYLRPVARLFLPVLAVVALLGTLSAALAPAASAHDVLLESSPADGAELTEVPTEVVLTFNNELLDASQAILVTDTAGEPVTDAPTVVAGRTASVPLPELTDGDYAVTWSVVSSDGHRIDGELGFTVAAGSEPSAPTTTDAAPSPDEATTPDATVTVEATSEPEETGAAGLPMWLWLVVSVGALGGVVAVAVRRWRDQG